MRYARRTDANQQAIFDAFRKLGCWVGDTSQLGGGFGDAVVAIPPAWSLAMIEVKDGAKPPSRRKLTEAQEKLHADCPAMIWIIENLEQVENMVRFYRNG